ncbi:DNA breaking-rejoining protein [Aeromonas veronii]|uniref:DNA breaking-rejoining protein n=1 Tax=Aeromonas veronii TaxID=654 RepID=UPI0029D97A8E|nr:DNA breaking-rejoining protein [Aeromonas veronii]MDX7744338.1 DNA breaking-rejoining protein [Aeromonas veronii]
MKKTMLVLACSIGLFGSSWPAFAANDSKAQQVQFKKGMSETTINSSIKGDQNLDYKLTANKGQKMLVTLDTKYNTYFNILPPGSTADAMFSGAMKGDRFEGELPMKGAYTIRVYQMGADKSSKAKHDFKLYVKISG